MDNSTASEIATATPSNVVDMAPYRAELVQLATVADVKLSAAFLRGMLIWACADEARFHMSGVHFDGRHVMATDGHRLVKATVIPIANGACPAAAYGVDATHRRNYTIPRDVLEAAVKAAGKGGSIEIRLATTKPTKGNGVHGVLVATKATPKKGGAVPGASVSIPWRAVDAQFPPTDQVIPAHTPLTSLASAAPVKRGSGKHTYNAQRDSGETDYFNACDIFGHGVNPRYLGDMADVIEGLTGGVTKAVACVACKGPLDPIVYEAIVIPVVDGRDQDVSLVTFVIMPMRLG